MAVAATSAIQRAGRALKADRYADALALLGPMVRKHPTNASAHYYLARAHFYLGDVHRAVHHLSRALKCGAGRRAAEFLATIAPFDPAIGHRGVLRHRQGFSALLRGTAPAVRREGRRRRHKRLRVGYVSSFFQDEHWMKPVWGLIQHHDRRRVDVHLFSDAPRSEVPTWNAWRRGDRFHDISRMDNAGAARLIARNQIDVLVDLNGYSKRTRLPVFMARPAPLQVEWFNIFGTSGMRCFDALIGDEWVVRQEEQRWFVEEVVRLPLSSLTFTVDHRAPDIQPPPCRKNRFITFGSLASMYKLNAATIGAWADILTRCPQSRLVLGNAALDDPANREHLRRRFSHFGIAAERLSMLGPAPHFEFLRYYDLIDVALDPFPYSGGTTTTEAIWQGVPVLTAGGDRWIARTSASILANAGLGRFVHESVAAYVDAAVSIGSSAATPRRLSALRRTLRERVRQSAVCDCARFARCMEHEYRRLSFPRITSPRTETMP